MILDSKKIRQWIRKQMETGDDVKGERKNAGIWDQCQERVV
jgi:hypothetical protein